MARTYPGPARDGLASLAAAYLSDHYGAPETLKALLIGLAMSFLSADKRLLPGLGFASRTLLRVGIVLVGARVTLSQIAHLGLPALASIVLIVATTLLTGALVARWLGFDWSFGVLASAMRRFCGNDGSEHRHSRPRTTKYRPSGVDGYALTLTARSSPPRPLSQCRPP